MIDQKLRQEMWFLLGQIEAIRYPLMWPERNHLEVNQAYYDLIDSIRDQYISVMKRTIGYEE